MALEGTTYVPYLGAGYALLNAIGKNLPDSFWRPQVQIYVTYANIVRRIWCLSKAGYTLDEIAAILSQEGRNINIESRGRGSPWDIWTRARDPILRGEQTQDEGIGSCAKMVQDYGYPIISPTEVAGGKPLYGPGGPPEIAPIPEIPPDTGPYTTVPPAQVPSASPSTPRPTTGPASRIPSGSTRTIDPVSLLKQMAQIFQNLWAWYHRARPISIQLPAWQTLVPQVQGGTNVAFVNTSVLGGEGGFGGLLSQALSTASSIWGQNQALPGGASLTSASLLPSLNLDIPGLDIVSQGMGTACTNLQSAFAAGGGRGARAKIHVLPDPITGRAVWFRPAGRPILWSSDLSACKRVRKVAARARRARGGR